MDELKYSEDPIKDIWKMILKYSYISNLDRYLVNNSDNDLKNFIASSIIQSSEYFNAYNKVSINTSPLLLYYGYVNLLCATSSMIINDKIFIKNHGLSLSLPDGYKKLGDAIITFSKSKEGAYYVYNQIFCDDIKYPDKISIMDVLSLVPEIKKDFENCYQISSLCIPIEVVKRKDDILERIRISELFQEFSPIDIVDYNKSYLQPQQTNDFIILRKKLNNEEIGHKSLSGQKFLFKYHNFDSKKYNYDQTMVFFLGLYALGYLSRYQPDVWYKFIQTDQTGEKSVIEDFLTLAHRILPNLMLNEILKKRIVFTQNEIGILDMSTNYDPDDVKKIVKEELRIYEKR